MRTVQSSTEKRETGTMKERIKKGSRLGFMCRKRRKKKIRNATSSYTERRPDAGRYEKEGEFPATDYNDDSELEGGRKNISLVKRKASPPWRRQPLTVTREAEEQRFMS